MMDRRELLKLSVFGVGAAVLPSLMGFDFGEKYKSETDDQQGYISMKLGLLEIFFFSDGLISLNNPQPIFAPAIDSEEVRKELKRIFLAEDKLEAAINVMLIKKGAEIILIDTGSGAHFGGGHLKDNMERAGIKATDITHIFLTHAHIDHIGGIIAKDGSLVYPNADYHLAQKEYDFWMSESPDFSKSKNTKSPKDSIALAQHVLGSIKDKLSLFHYGEVLYSCIQTELAEGHTPGHTIFNIFSDGKSIQHIVDIVHTPLLVVKPEWGTQWDVDFEKGIAKRKEILERSYLNRTLLMTTHLPWPGLGHIGKNGNSYQWIPFSYFIPSEIVL